MPAHERIRVTVVGAEHLDIEYAKLVNLTGEMILEWANLDTLLSLALSQIGEMDISTAEIIYFSPSSFSGRLQILRNITKHLMPEMNEKRELLQLYEKIDQLHKIRNSLTHSAVRFNIHHDRSRSQLMRHEVRPNRNEIRREFKAQASTIEEHLRQIGNVSQYLFAIGIWMSPHNRRSVEMWAKAVFDN